MSADRHGAKVGQQPGTVVFKHTTPRLRSLSREAPDGSLGLAWGLKCRQHPHEL